MTTFTARNPVDLIAVVPYVIGFHPEDSVVLLTFGPGEAFHARVDLPDEEDAQEELAAMLAELVAQREVERVALLLYTADTEVAGSFHDIVVPELVGEGVEVIDMLRVSGERFYAAYDVDDPGTAYDLTTHLFTAEQVLEGKVAHHSRAELVASLDTIDADDARAVQEAAIRFDEQFEGLPRFVTVARISRDIVEEARWVQRTVRRHVRLGTPLSVDDAGRLLVLMAGVPLRDVAWAEMSRDNAAGHIDLWRDLVRRCPSDLLPAAASLLAFAAWLHGDGAFAWCALDRCVEVDPAYSMAGCIALLLEQAIPPSSWIPIREDELQVFWPVSLPDPPMEAS
jgi:hypothetical protein